MTDDTISDHYREARIQHK